MTPPALLEQVAVKAMLSMSVATRIVTAVSSGVVAVPLMETGGSLTAVTVMVTVAVDESWPSVTVYVNESGPL